VSSARPAFILAGFVTFENPLLAAAILTLALAQPCCIDQPIKSERMS